MDFNFCSPFYNKNVTPKVLSSRSVIKRHAIHLPDAEAISNVRNRMLLPITLELVLLFTMNCQIPPVTLYFVKKKK